MARVHFPLLFTSGYGQLIPFHLRLVETGPEGWVSRLPILGFEWFVYSLRSRVDFIVSLPAQKIQVAGSGWAHQEKNWGASFPDAWSAF